MNATSAFKHFAPRIENAYEKLIQSHHSATFQAACGGCRLSAEATLQEALRTWEWFVKEVLIDLMYSLPTGHRNVTHSITRTPYATRNDARLDLLRTKYRNQQVSLANSPSRYLLLHNPDMVIAVAAYWVPNSSIESVFRNCNADIQEILKIRHGLAHGTAHAQQEARVAMLNYDPLHTYKSIGHFLLAKPALGAPTWIENLLGDLYRYAAMISP